jgi:hypothetical protein
MKLDLHSVDPWLVAPCDIGRRATLTPTSMTAIQKGVS